MTTIRTRARYRFATVQRQWGMSRRDPITSETVRVIRESMIPFVGRTEYPPEPRYFPNGDTLTVPAYPWGMPDVP